MFDLVEITFALVCLFKWRQGHVSIVSIIHTVKLWPQLTSLVETSEQLSRCTVSRVFAVFRYQRMGRKQPVLARAAETFLTFTWKYHKKLRKLSCMAKFLAVSTRCLKFSVPPKYSQDKPVRRLGLVNLVGTSVLSTTTMCSLKEEIKIWNVS